MREEAPESTKSETASEWSFARLGRSMLRDSSMAAVYRTSDSLELEQELVDTLDSILANPNLATDERPCEPVEVFAIALYLIEQGRRLANEETVILPVVGQVPVDPDSQATQLLPLPFGTGASGGRPALPCMV